MSGRMRRLRSCVCWPSSSRIAAVIRAASAAPYARSVPRTDALPSRVVKSIPLMMSLLVLLGYKDRVAMDLLSHGNPLARA